MASATYRGRIIVNDTDYTGSFVDPNPSGVATDSLTKLGIDGAIYEIQGSGGGGANLIVDAQIYSLEEKQVGVWTDGKPIYQKTVISTTAPSQNTWTTITLDLPTDAVVTKYEAYYRRSPNRTDFIPQYNPTGSNEWLFGALSNNNFVYKVGSPYVANFLETYITVWYTKTTDTAGSGGFQAYGFTPVIYSTEEREVGVWTDGKPIYKRTWLLSNEVLVNSNGVTISEIDASMIEHLIECNGGFQPLSNTKSIPILVWKYNNTWYYGSSINAYIDTVTLTYTKTTDVAGSGEYNTLGIPNVHYDGNERIVGTFFGKTLYQKSEHIILSTPISPNTDTTVNFSNFSNITSFLSLEAVGGLYGNSDHVTATYGFWEQSTSGSSSGDRIIKEWDMSHMVVRTGSNYNNFPSAGVDNRIREFWVTMRYTKD